MTDPTRIAITGAAGFLGSNLTARLLEAGHRVVAIDNLSMGVRRNLAGYLDHPELEFLQGDVTDQAVFSSVSGKVDCIVHLAAFKIPRYGKAIDTLRINYHGTENALEFARRKECKLVLSSTSDVYGRNPRIPFHEDDSDSVIGTAKSPRWAYAVSKLFDEHMALAYQDAFDLPVTVLRIFGSYGPHQHLNWWGGAPPVFIEAILDDKPIPIHGDGSQTRSFTYVSDTVDAIAAAIVTAEANGEIINVGSDEEVSILELARRIKLASDTPGDLKVEFVPYASFTGKQYQDVMRRVPDTSRCERVLGMRARVGLDEGLARTIAWQRVARKQSAGSEPPRGA